MADERTIQYGERGHVLVVADGDALALKAAETLARVINQAANEGRKALVALSGGSTPKAMGTLLSASPFKEAIPWDKAEFFWGDERSVPLDDAESNAGEALRGFLNEVDVPAESIHTWDTTNTNLDAAAKAYAETIVKVGGSELPPFDLVFLGMGDDGHTLSLFPGTTAVHDLDNLTSANQVETLDTTRLTMTRKLVNNAKLVVFLVGGGGKAATLHDVLDGAEQIDTYPSQSIRPTDGRLVWVIDEAAAANLERSSDG